MTKSTANIAADVLAPDDRLYVVVGVLVNETGELLIQQRRLGTPKAGKWEFPGGKLEKGESPIEGLARELEEELGVTVSQCQPLTIVTFDYDHARVWLDTYLVTDFDGVPIGREGQRIGWVLLEKMEGYDLLPAVAPIVEGYRKYLQGK